MQKIRLVKTGKIREDDPVFNCPEVIYKECHNMRKLDREHFVVLHLNGKGRILAKETIAFGTLSEALVHPHEVFKGAVHYGSVAIIAVHNHPSENPCPSAEDLKITRRLQEAGEILGIDVLDHIVIGDSSFWSISAMLISKDSLLKTSKLPK